MREFVAEYRALAADLARLRTAAGGRALDELFQLGRLVAGAHNLLYRDRGMPLRAAVRYLFTEGPREVTTLGGADRARRTAAVPAGDDRRRSPWRGTRRSRRSCMPRAMLDRADDGVRRARTGEGYIDDPQLFRPVMASGIIANNVQVTFATFAGGITAGLLSMLLLVMNGVSLGSVVGLYASKGIVPAARGVRRAARRAGAVRHLRGGGRGVPRRRGDAPPGRRARDGARSSRTAGARSG